MESADSRGDHRELVAACKDEARLYPTQELRGRQWALVRLPDLGCAPERSEFEWDLKAMHNRCLARDGHLKGYGLHIACREGWSHTGELWTAMQEWIKEVEELDFWRACPWTGEVHLHGLWAGREHGDVMPLIDGDLATKGDRLKDGRHWPIYTDPLGWLECMGAIDHSCCPAGGTGGGMDVNLSLA